MKPIADYAPGERFFFNGDWQTDPGVWEVVSHDDEFGMTRCRPITNKHEGVSEFFSRGVNITPAPSANA
jgi:hypothetical protein